MNGETHHVFRPDAPARSQASHGCPFTGSTFLPGACGRPFPGQAVLEPSEFERSGLLRDSRVDCAINNPRAELLEQLNFNWVTQEIARKLFSFLYVSYLRDVRSIQQRQPGDNK